MAPDVQNYELPLTVTGPVDIGRLMRELDQLDNQLSQLELRGVIDPADTPKVSSLLGQMLDLNKLSLLQPHDRQQLAASLASSKVHAPLLHISFSADPSADFMQRLLAWLRKEIHPTTLVTVGLQPNIGAGCIVRSTNKYFDFSLRQDFLKKRDLLLAELGPALRASADTAPTAELVAAAPVTDLEEQPRTAAPHATAMHATTQPQGVAA